MIRNYKKQERKKLRAIRAAAKRGGSEPTRYAQFEYFNSYAARMCAAEYALRKTRPADDAAPPDLHDIEELAAQINVWSEPNEPIRTRRIEKPSGGYRLIHEFGPRNRAVQYLIRSALNATVEAKPGQFDREGRGRDDLIRAAERWIEAGYKWVVLVDIRDCYGSLSWEGLVETLPLPRNVIAQHVLARPQRIRMSRQRQLPVHRHTVAGRTNYSPSTATGSQGPAGIYQGSAASSIVASIALSDIFDLFPEETPVGQFGDDIAVFAQTRREACSILNALVDALSEHRCGPMELKRQEIRRCSDGFELLGYWLRLKGGQCNIAPTARNTKKLWRRLSETLERDFDDRKQISTSIDKTTSDWISGFSAAQGNSYRKSAVLTEARHRYLLARGANDKRFLFRRIDIRQEGAI